MTPEPLETLRVGLPEGNKTYHDVYREWVAAIPVPRPPGSPEELAAYAATARPALARKLGLPNGPGPATVRAVREAEAGGVRAGFFAVETEPGITIPVAEFRPAGDGPRHVELIVGERAGVARRGRVGPGRGAGRAGGRAPRGRRGGLGRPSHRQRRLVLRPAPGRPGGVRRPPGGRAVARPARRRLDLPRRLGALGQGGAVRRRARPGDRRPRREPAPDRPGAVRGRGTLGPGRRAGPARRRRPAPDRRPRRPAPVRWASRTPAPTPGPAPPTASSAPTHSRSRRRNPTEPPRRSRGRPTREEDRAQDDPQAFLHGIDGGRRGPAGPRRGAAGAQRSSPHRGRRRTGGPGTSRTTAREGASTSPPSRR